MVKNIGSYIRIFCMEHEKPVPFVEDPYHSQYVCAHHFPKDDEHPDGYETEPRCDEVLSYTDYMKIIEKMEAIVEKDTMSLTEANYTGLRFTHKTINAKVLRHTDKHIDIGVSYTVRR